MARHTLFTVMLAALLVAGCGMFSSSKPPVDKTALFHLGPEEARIFVYGTYAGDPGSWWFRSTYRVRIDNGYGGDITDDTQFISVKNLPGDYVIDVEEIGWLGNSVGHATLKAHLGAGGVFYANIRMPLGTDPKANLKEIDGATGFKEIMGRTRTCMC